MSDVTRSSMKTPCVVRMSGDLRDQVAAMAAREERSFSSMFRQLIRRGLDAEGQQARAGRQPNAAPGHPPGEQAEPEASRR